MKLLWVLTGVMVLCSCGQHENKNPSPEEIENAKKILMEDDATHPFLGDEEESEEESEPQNKKDTSGVHKHQEYVANYFVLITDTGLNYFELRSKMFELSEKLSIPIDSLDREYNEEKNLIALPADDPDPTYAGEYFQRRFPSNNLSLEYVTAYQTETREKNIGIVAGIFENEEDAIKSLEKFKEISSQVFIVKAQVYLGCIH